MHPGWLALSAVALSHLGSIARLRHGSAPSLAPASDASPVRPAGGLAGVGRAIRQIEVKAGLATMAAVLFVTRGKLLGAGAPSARCATDAASAAAPFGCIEEGATDPSLLVQTNVKLGDKKMEFMKAASKAVANCLGKPESYVAVLVQDGQDMIWGGSEAPCALCKVISLGSINKENNGALTKEISALLADFDVAPNRLSMSQVTVLPTERCFSFVHLQMASEEVFVWIF
ncbi:unnamed protein product [Durusdinium trenchii]|uniref:L-dopachrome isomerase n=1 Tax=Durusdinium trenchii TaxID=1381693 RepID=A0ABP0SNA9_9DINO